MENVWKERLEELASEGLARRMRVLEGPVGSVVETDEGRKILFCSNDYLGLANSDAVKKAMADAAFKWGAGAAASRLISGNTGAHARLERALAEQMKTEEAVLFPSGYQTNVGVLSTVAARGDVIFSDELIHASMVDGCRLSKAEVRVFRHRDLRHLGDLLEAERNARVKFIVTDAVFSMDGDKADLTGLANLAREFDAVLYVDEAHAFGVLGSEGRGLADELGVADQAAIRIATLGKSLGLAGGFVACDRWIAGLLRSSARSLLYTTAAPAPIAEAALTSLNIVKSADHLRKSLKENVEFFKRLAHQAEIPTLPSDTAIQPVILGSSARATVVSDRLWEDGLFVQGIRPPTVPEGSSRLRITINASHTVDQIEMLVDRLDRILKETKGI